LGLAVAGCFVDEGPSYAPPPAESPGGKADEIDGTAGDDGDDDDASGDDVSDDPTSGGDPGTTDASMDTDTTGEPVDPSGDPVDTTGDVEMPLHVVVNELVCDPVSGDSDWIELLNLGGEAVDLGGFQLRDTGNLFVIPPGTTIAPGEYIVFVEGEPGSFQFGLSKDGDVVELYDDAGELHDFTVWGGGAAPGGTSWGRSPDGTGSFGTLGSPTPGSTND
jgi:hypothetical protein